MMLKLQREIRPEGITFVIINMQIVVEAKAENGPSRKCESQSTKNIVLTLILSISSYSLHLILCVTLISRSMIFLTSFNFIYPNLDGMLFQLCNVVFIMSCFFLKKSLFWNLCSERYWEYLKNYITKLGSRELRISWWREKSQLLQTTFLPIQNHLLFQWFSYSPYQCFYFHLPKHAPHFALTIFS